MTAVLIPTSSEAEWLAARRKGVTASEIAIVMGLSPYGSPYALYHEKAGILDGQADAAVMERGRDLEPIIARKFAEAHPDLMICGSGRELFARESRRWQMATPDRVIASDMTLGFDHGVIAEEIEPAAVLECKADGGSDEWGEPGTDEIPVHYRAQALWQMDVMGVSRAVVACLKVRDWRVDEYAVELDDAGRADLALMLQEAERFLARLVTGDPPDVDWRPATLAALRSLHPGEPDGDVEVRRSLAIQYRAAQRRFKAAERRKDEMTARMLLALGDGKRAIEACTDRDGSGGTVVAARSVSHPKRIDTERLRAEQPAIAAAYTKPPKPEVKLTPAKPKKDKP